MDVIQEIIEQSHQADMNDMERYSKVLKAKLEIILAELLDECSDINGAMVSSTDGLAWAKKLQENMDENRFSAMSSALLALSDNLVRETHQGNIRKVLLESSGGNVLVLHAGKILNLTVFTRENVNIGMSLAHANKTAEDISNLMEQCSS